MEQGCLVLQEEKWKSVKHISLSQNLLLILQHLLITLYNYNILWLPSITTSRHSVSQNGGSTGLLLKQKTDHHNKIPGALPVGCIRFLSTLLLPVAVHPQDFGTAQSSYCPGISYSNQVYSSFINPCYNFERLGQFMNLHLYLDTDRIVVEIDFKRPYNHTG